MEKRKKEEQANLLKHKKHNEGKGYGQTCRSKRIPYPFLTFHNDDLFADFMIKIISILEVRYFDQGQVIYKELDEC